MGGVRSWTLCPGRNRRTRLSSPLPVCDTCDPGTPVVVPILVPVSYEPGALREVLGAPEVPPPPPVRKHTRSKSRGTLNDSVSSS